MRGEGFAAAALVALLAGVPMAGAHETQSGLPGRPHVHGEAVLNVAVEADALYLELIAPAESLLGFERQPTRPADQAALATLRQRLTDGASLFALVPACEPVSVEIEDPFAAAESATHGDQDGAARAADEQAHADFVVRIAFACAEPPEALELRVFEPFQRLARVRAQFVTARGQGTALLTRQAPQLRW